VPRRETFHALVQRARHVAAQEQRSAPTALNWFVTVLVLAAMVTATVQRTGAPEPLTAGLVIAVLGAWAPLMARTRRPIATLAVIVVVEVLIVALLAVPDPLARDTSGMGAYQPVPLASMVAAFTVASRTPRRVGWILGCAAGAVIALAGIVTHGHVTFLTDLVVFYLVATGTAIGAMTAARRDNRVRKAREQQEVTERAVLDERLRIARELHDVLAHNLTLVNAQAGVAAYLLEAQPQAAAAALRDITGHTRRAIDELRATIGLLRGADDPGDAASASLEGTMRPVPGLQALEDLLVGFRAAGAHITVAVSGTPSQLDQHGDLAAYRIIQEALTNATKHAPLSRVAVSLAWTDSDLCIRVVNPVPPATERRAPAPGTGHGLIGMRERAVAAGGNLQVGPDGDGQFEVAAVLPLARTGRVR
jgi:signal transduction histidine kinase